MPGALPFLQAVGWSLEGDGEMQVLALPAAAVGRMAAAVAILNAAWAEQEQATRAQAHLRQA